MWPILGRGLNRRGKGGSRPAAAPRTAFLLHTVFAHHDPLWGQIEDLAAFGIARQLCLQVRATTITALDSMDDHLVRGGHAAQVVAAMPCLSSWWFAALLAQTPGPRNKAIRGGRLAAVMAVFLQPFL